MTRNAKTIYVPDWVDLKALIDEAARELSKKGYRVTNYQKREEQSDSAVVLAALWLAAGLNPDGKKSEPES